MYQKLSGSGSQAQSTEYNQFNAEVIHTNAPRISAQIGSRDSIEQLATQPGMAWVGGGSRCTHERYLLLAMEDGRRV